MLRSTFLLLLMCMLLSSCSYFGDFGDKFVFDEPYNPHQGGLKRQPPLNHIPPSPEEFYEESDY